jgi:hypothetical protein
MGEVIPLYLKKRSLMDAARGRRPSPASRQVQYPLGSFSYFLFEKAAGWSKIYHRDELCRLAY